jgi:hypothetical protein
MATCSTSAVQLRVKDTTIMTMNLEDCFATTMNEQKGTGMMENETELPSERAQRHAIVLGFFDKPPPRDIKVDRGLPPKRTELAKFLAWEQRTRDEIADLQRRRTELASAVAAPVHTHEKIAQLERADLANLRTASGPVNATLTRTAERDALVTRERRENYEADQARRALRQAARGVRQRRAARVRHGPVRGVDLDIEAR